MLCRRKNLEVMDYKIFPEESMTSQNRAVLCKIRVEKMTKWTEKREPRIR